MSVANWTARLGGAQERLGIPQEARLLLMKMALKLRAGQSVEELDERWSSFIVSFGSRANQNTAVALEHKLELADVETMARETEHGLSDTLSVIYCIVAHNLSDRVSRAAVNAGGHGPIVFYSEGRGLRDIARAGLEALEAELARRIGRERFEALNDALEIEWGEPPAGDGATQCD